MTKRSLRKLAREIHNAGLTEIRKREGFDDGSHGLYEKGSPRLIAAMEGIAEWVNANFVSKAKD